MKSPFPLLPVQHLIYLLLTIILFSGTASCVSTSQPNENKEKTQSGKVTKQRDDGTISSVSSVDENGYVHGVRVNYYEDGKTVHSRITYEHGRKHGPAIWYYKNGQIYEHTSYYQNRKHGVTKRYYKTGELMEEVTYEAGEELPGKKRYNSSGKLISGG